MRTGVSEVNQPFLPVSQQWHRWCISGLLVTVKRLDFSHKITPSCLLSVFCVCFVVFVFVFSLSFQFVSAILSGRDRRFKEKASTVIPNAGGVGKK